MGLAETLETHAADKSSLFVRELAEELAEHAGSMVKRFARPGGNTAAEETQPVSGEQIGREFAANYAAALQSFKENASGVTEAEQRHAASELAGLAADVTRRNLGLTVGKEAGPVKGQGSALAG